MVGKAAITTSTNEAYGKVKAAEGEGYEMVDIPPPATPTKIEEMYEVPSSPNQPSLPLLLLPLLLPLVLLWLEQGMRWSMISFLEISDRTLV